VTETLLACGWECGARTAVIKYVPSPPLIVAADPYGGPALALNLTGFRMA
jgi:hypothetical protein